LLDVAKILTNKEFSSVDECWNYFKSFDRSLGSKFYNIFKRLPSVHKLAINSNILLILRKITRMKSPAIIDINCRIDSQGEEEYLFDWHQDYWSSICSKQAVVVWIPLTDITVETGGISLISNHITKGKIYKATKGEVYNTYADAVKLNEQIPISEVISVRPKMGDIALFKFNVMHKSNPVITNELSRFTIQLRFADCSDYEFISNDYKPGIINSETVDYLKRGEVI
jgi:ectoine hydroxylase-related dioxygenase (phytanoyl-CoA dioxygenase family)